LKPHAWLPIRNTLQAESQGEVLAARSHPPYGQETEGHLRAFNYLWDWLKMADILNVPRLQVGALGPSDRYRIRACAGNICRAEGPTRCGSRIRTRSAAGSGAWLRLWHGLSDKSKSSPSSPSALCLNA